MTPSNTNTFRAPSSIALASINAERLEIVTLSTVAVGIPLLLQHPQPLVGAAVNFALVLGALQARSWKSLLPLATLPALAAIAGGALFGTHVGLGLLLLVPFIWLGNASLVTILRRAQAQSLARHLPTLAAGSIAKTLVILFGAWAIVASGLLPHSFLSVMAPLQLATAMIGGLLAWPAALVIARMSREEAN